MPGYPPPRVQLGRYAKTATPTEPVFARRRTVQRPPKITGMHRWIALSWHHITQAQALSLSRGARFNPSIDDRLAVEVGCLDCQGTWAAAGEHPCPAPAIEDVPAEPAPPDPVPVDPPTSPDAEPPVVTGEPSIGALAEQISETALSPVRVEP